MRGGTCTASQLIDVLWGAWVGPDEIRDTKGISSEPFVPIFSVQKVVNHGLPKPRSCCEKHRAQFVPRSCLSLGRNLAEGNFKENTSWKFVDIRRTISP